MWDLRIHPWAEAGNAHCRRKSVQDHCGPTSIKECEGHVTELSLFVTGLRTGRCEAIASPNALVLGNLTRNFSSIRNSAGHVLDTTVTIGYDTPAGNVQVVCGRKALLLAGVVGLCANECLQLRVAEQAIQVVVMA